MLSRTRAQRIVKTDLQGFACDGNSKKILSNGKFDMIDYLF